MEAKTLLCHLLHEKHLGRRAHSSRFKPDRQLCKFKPISVWISKNKKKGEKLASPSQKKPGEAK